MAASRLTRAVRRDFDPSQAAAKADASPVTVADLGAQALVSMALAEALPGDGLMGEEDFGPLAASADLAGAVLARVREQRPETTLDELRRALDRCDDPGGPGRRWWTLDPVDGTKGFLRNEQYAVALALIEDGQVVLAAMACPNLPLAGEPGTSGEMAARLARPTARLGRPGLPLHRRAGPGRRHAAARRGRDRRAWCPHPCGIAGLSVGRSVRGIGRGGPLGPVRLRAHRPAPGHHRRAPSPGQPDEVRGRGSR